MPNIKTYVELPFIGEGDFESDFVCAFGYVDIDNEDIGRFLIARQFRDNCTSSKGNGISCGCDLDYYNPAFLMASDTFSESLSEGSASIRGVVQIFESLDDVEKKIFELKEHNLHKGNDLIAYQINGDAPDYTSATFTMVKIYKSA